MYWPERRCPIATFVFDYRPRFSLYTRPRLPASCPPAARRLPPSHHNSFGTAARVAGLGWSGPIFISLSQFQRPIVQLSLNSITKHSCRRSFLPFSDDVDLYKLYYFFAVEFYSFWSSIVRLEPFLRLGFCPRIFDTPFCFVIRPRASMIAAHRKTTASQHHI